jgi:hypothetical protein
MSLPEKNVPTPNVQNFEQPALPKKKLTEIFNKFSANALKDFPKLKDSFMLIDGKTGQAIGEVDPDKLRISPQELATKIAQQANAEQPGGGYAETYQLQPDYFSTVVKKGEIYAIRYNQNLPVTGDAERDTLLVLEHELGHAVVPGAIGANTNVNYAESAADVFAMLKYIGRNGDDGIITKMARMRSIHLLSGDLDHFTNAALSVLNSEKNTLDVAHLTPVQLTDTAQRICTQTQFSVEDRMQLAGLLNKTGAVFARSGTRAKADAFLMELGRRLCSENVYQSEFKLGLSILKPFMEDVPGQPLPAALQGSEWEMLKRSLLEKEKIVQPAPVQPEPVRPRLPTAFDPDANVPPLPRPQPRWATGPRPAAG